MPTCAVSVDLDEIRHYASVHGLASMRESHAVYDVAVPRLHAFAAETAIPLTVFVVANDVKRPANAAGLRRFVTSGHEIGNHTLDHLYDLTRRNEAEQWRQVEGANALLSSELGVSVRGFRAPGYTVTDALLTVVRRSGLIYDSSVFSCPPYFAAKAFALLTMKLRNRASHSVLDTPRVLAAPTEPYRVGEPYWRRDENRRSGLVELPIHVVGPLRLPFIGTTLTLLGPSGARLLTRSILGSPFVNLELHGMDFLEAGDVPEALRGVQPDLRVSWARKRETLEAVIELFRSRGYEFVRLADAARGFGAESATGEAP